MARCPLLRLHDQAVDLEALELSTGVGGGRRIEARIARAKEQLLSLLHLNRDGRAAGENRTRARAHGGEGFEWATRTEDRNRLYFEAMMRVLDRVNPGYAD